MPQHVQAPFARARRSLALGALVIATGIGVGVLTSFGQTWLSGAASAFANSASAWLVAPYVLGALMPSARTAALAGLVACALQVVGYYATSELRGFPSGGAILVFWTAAAIVGGPVFGLAGHLWRTGPVHVRALGPAVLAGVFIAEGTWVYLHVLGYYSTAALWLSIGAVLAASMIRRWRDLRWLALTVGAGLVGEVLLARIYDQSF